MRSFYYYMPALATKDVQAHIDAAGIRYAFPKGAFTGHRNVSGPDGKQGMLFYAEDLVDPNYCADRQTWEQFDGLWIGYETDSSPNPEALLLPDCTEAHPVRLADGNEWLIPVVRKFPLGYQVVEALPGSTALPLVMARGSDGTATYRVGRANAELWRLCERAKEDLFGDAGGFRVEDSLRLAELALSVNYRVSWREISLLELIDTRQILAVVRALLDLPTFDRLKDQYQDRKKNGISSDGPAS